MKYLNSKEIAKKWKISDRMVRNYCHNGLIANAYVEGKTWKIPSNSKKPNRYKSFPKTSNILNALLSEKNNKINGGLYYKTQIDFSYNTNHIEGSKLSHDQTRFIYETNSILNEKDVVLNIDDIIETSNHFRCFGYILDTINSKLSEKNIKELHRILKTGTSDSRLEWFNVGDYKKLPNVIGSVETTQPNNVKIEMQNLLLEYNSKKNITFEDILDFHYKFEKIHPFQDGNGRVGRLIMFKECLRNGIIPFIIDEYHKIFYYRGLKEWNDERGYLIDTCLSCQDKYRKILDYFKIKY